MGEIGRVAYVEYTVRVVCYEILLRSYYVIAKRSNLPSRYNFDLRLSSRRLTIDSISCSIPGINSISKLDDYKTKLTSDPIFD